MKACGWFVASRLGVISQKPWNLHFTAGRNTSIAFYRLKGHDWPKLRNFVLSLSEIFVVLMPGRCFGFPYILYKPNLKFCLRTERHFGKRTSCHTVSAPPRRMEQETPPYLWPQTLSQHISQTWNFVWVYMFPTIFLEIPWASTVSSYSIMGFVCRYVTVALRSEQSMNCCNSSAHVCYQNQQRTPPLAANLVWWICTALELLLWRATRGLIRFNKRSSVCLSCVTRSHTWSDKCCRRVHGVHVTGQ